jgi:hypothetical protein
VSEISDPKLQKMHRIPNKMAEFTKMLSIDETDNPWL